MSSIPIPEPTLSTRAMLCSLSISQWSASKHDPQASQEIAAHHGAQPDVGRYNKLLIPKETLAEVHRIAGEARREHYFMTLPWDDNGYPYVRIARMWEQQDKTIAQIAHAIGRIDKNNPQDPYHSVRNAMYRMRRWGYINEYGKRVKLGSYRVDKSTRKASRVAGLRGGHIRHRK